MLRPAGFLVLVPETGQHGVQQGQGPVAFEEPLGGGAVRWLAQVAALGVAGVDRQPREASAALRGPVVLAAVEQEAGAVGQQEGPEPALARVGRRDGAPLEQPGEVVLRQVQGLIRTVSLAADEGVERIPVAGAQLGQCRTRLGRGPIAGREHTTPARRRELGRRGTAFHDGPPHQGSEISPGQDLQAESDATLRQISR